MSKHELWAFMDTQLVIIDSIFAAWGTPLHHRPFLAADFFVTECIIEISNGSLENYLSEPWFGEMVRHAREWYVERYGRSVLAAEPDSAVGAVLIHHTPFLLDIPVTVARAVPERGLHSLHFPLDLLDGEDPTNWLTAAPNLDQLSDQETTALRSELHRIAVATRKLHTNLTMARLELPEARALSSGIRTSFDRGVAAICAPSQDERRSAIWDLHFAVEQAVKVYLLFRTGQVQRTHDLRLLFNDAVQHGLQTPSEDLFKHFPPTPSVVAARYGEGPPPSTRQLMAMYHAAVDAALLCAEALPHDVKVLRPGATVYFKPLDWAWQRSSVANADQSSEAPQSDQSDSE